MRRELRLAGTGNDRSERNQTEGTEKGTESKEENPLDHRSRFPIPKRRELGSGLTNADEGSRQKLKTI